MRLLRLLKWLLISSFFLFLAISFSAYFVYARYLPELPDTDHLRDVKYQTPLNIYTREGLLIAQFGEKKRFPIRVEEAPPQLINAFLAAEDDRFFEHPGIDYKGLLRASLQLLWTGEKKQGGSTITMQVARNFLLTPEKTFTRKIKEIILALKIEQELSKHQILELYLNKIYLGHHAYGVAAASQIYYGKPLSELNTAQLAMIAGLPKAPSLFNPITNPQKSIERRNYVLRRMYDLGYINEVDYGSFSGLPVTAELHSQPSEVPAPYVAEMVRSEIFDQYGEDSYVSGLKVYTTIRAHLQKAATHALRQTLHAYDERHGYRNQQGFPAATTDPVGETMTATVEKITDHSVYARLQDETEIEIPWGNLRWARKFKTRNYTDNYPQTPQDIFNIGDPIRVRSLDDGTWSLAQIPEVEGAIVALEPASGAIVALSGGYDFNSSKFNRATQAKRQPGSGFKPILYTTALEEGYTPASIINDAPVVYDDPSQESEWRPENYSGKFFGPTRLRTALSKSRNLISVRLMRQIGIAKVIATATRFGLPKDQLPDSLSLALGSSQATPLEMARVFAVFANGGFLVKPYFIDRIESYSGEVLYQAKPEAACPACIEDHYPNAVQAPRIISPEIHFLMNSLLRDVVAHGTATRAMQLGRTDLAGKTGTTNEQRDAWFNGFTPSLVATCWVGFDDSSPLGSKETGGEAALPMWMNFMKVALKDLPEHPLQPPENIVRARIDPTTGLLATPEGSAGIWEYFIKESAPRQFTNTYSRTTDDSDGEKTVDALF
ncbi:MAG: penicillin-binding protein 1A [Gammaproteobacteria bacterium]